VLTVAAWVKRRRRGGLVVRSWLKKLPMAGVLALLLSGCGSQAVLLDPKGPVGRVELNLMDLSFVAMAAVILLVFVLFTLAVLRFRDTKGNKNPYTPNVDGHKVLEVLWFIVPALILTVIAVPTVQETYALAKVPSRHAMVVDVTSTDWKWVFEYPAEHVATVNHLVIPAGRPVLFELTAYSPMNAFWIPQLGGMEYAMPGRVLPLWLESSKPGTYWGHSAQFSGREFEKMFFTVKAVTPSQFSQWVATVRRSAPPMTMADYHRLLQPNTVGDRTYSAYPPLTFPSVTHGFTLKGGMYYVMHNNPAND
jgi:cytochrome aa3-600 menaquinol oxidase subunit 2